MQTQPTKSDDNRVRRLARREGYYLRKSRHGLSLDNAGEYCLHAEGSNLIVLGARFDASLPEIENWLRG